MASLNDKWKTLTRYCDQKNIRLEDVLYSRDRRAATIRAEISGILYYHGLADQKSIAEVFNVSQQAVSKRLRAFNRSL
jgi:hypothetical protein